MIDAIYEPQSVSMFLTSIKIYYPITMKLRNHFALLTLAIAGSMAAQTRFIYQATLKTGKDLPATTENAYLDVNNGKSLFYAEKQAQREAMMRRARETQNFNFDRSQMEQYRSAINYQIEKEYETGKTIYKSRLGRDAYSYEEDRSQEWKISPETMKIGEYKVQKAETDFGGRHWVAWFTTDVSFPDGPYKFRGLPGLIVKAEDTTGDYSFDLKQTLKLPEDSPLMAAANPSRRAANTVKLSRKNYEKQMQRFREDPVAFMQANMGGAPPPPGFRGGAPDPARAAQRQREMQQRLTEEIKNTDNPIERE